MISLSRMSADIGLVASRPERSLSSPPAMHIVLYTLSSFSIYSTYSLSPFPFSMFGILRIRDAPRVRSMSFTFVSQDGGGILQPWLVSPLLSRTFNTLLHVGFGSSFGFVLPHSRLIIFRVYYLSDSRIGSLLGLYTRHRTCVSCIRLLYFYCISYRTT